jgi:hypothetical protein
MLSALSPPCRKTSPSRRRMSEAASTLPVRTVRRAGRRLRRHGVLCSSPRQRAATETEEHTLYGACVLATAGLVLKVPRGNEVPRGMCRLGAPSTSGTATHGGHPALTPPHQANLSSHNTASPFSLRLPEFHIHVPATSRPRPPHACAADRQHLSTAGAAACLLVAFLMTSCEDRHRVSI